MSRGGPASREGKEVVRWNATLHGISSPAPVVPGLEEPQHWHEHRQGVLESLQRRATSRWCSRSAWPCSPGASAA